MDYLFIFGNTPALSLAELEALLKNRSVSFKKVSSGQSWLIINTGSSDLEKTIFPFLGGTVKIGKGMGLFSDESALEKAVVDSLAGEPAVTFGLSRYTDRVSSRGLTTLSKSIKDQLKEKSSRVRFVLPKDESGLSSVVVTKQKVDEFIIAEAGGGLFLAKTLAVSDFAAWNHRDYGRPLVNAHLGMLPPRVARMMVNLACVPEGGTIFDPFCGSGTILMEALMTNHNCVGGDNNYEQIARAQANLSWLAKEVPLNSGFKLFSGNAVVRPAEITAHSIDAVVTEPDLGPSNIVSPQQIQAVTIKLLSLYSQALKNWQSLLTDRGRVVMVIPSYFINGKLNNILLKKVIDNARVMGYSLFESPWEYFRPQALVRRNITVFYGTR